MTRLRLLPLVLGVIVAAACNKPSEDNCRKALANMQTLLGTEHVSTPTQIEGEVRRCKGGSSRSAVDCAIKATTLTELRACGFFKIPESAFGGSAAPAAGSAAGSATN